MAESTEIQWTDSTWNVVTGCTRVSPGCAHCYIERTPPFRMSGRRFTSMGDGEATTGVTLHWDRLDRVPRGPKVFTPSLGDLFHEEVPDEFIVEAFARFAIRDDRAFQVLTKRPERARAIVGREGFHEEVQLRVERLAFDGTSRMSRDRRSTIQGRARAWLSLVPWPLPNVWMGVSIENARFTYRADVLREIPAAVRFISAEPLLGSLYADANRSMPETADFITGARKPLDLTGIDWVIVGGESGPKARPFHLEHAREIIEAARRTRYCARCGDPKTKISAGECLNCGSDALGGSAVFVKQLGAKPLGRTMALTVHNPSTVTGRWAEAPLKLRDRKGGDWDEWPADLRIREFPRSAA